MKISENAVCHIRNALLLIAITATLGCRNNKPTVNAQSQQPATPVTKAQTDSSPASNTPALSSPAPVTPASGEPSEAVEHFAKGKKLIEENCGECGGTRSGVQEGMTELQKAIDLRYEPAKDVYKLLSDGYADLAAFTKDQEEEKAFWAKQNEIYQRLYELDPRDPQILEDYALRVAKTNDEKLKVLEQAVTIDPKRATTQFLLSLTLIEKKDFSHGISALQEAVKNESNGESLVNEVGRTLEALDKNGCTVAAVDQEHWNEEANSASSKSIFREGDPKAIPEFKDRFLKFTNGLSCPTQTATASQ